MSVQLQRGQSINLTTGKIETPEDQLRSGVRRNDVEALYMLIFPNTPETSSWVEDMRDAS